MNHSIKNTRFLLKTTSLVAGLLILPACTPTTNTAIYPAPAGHSNFTEASGSTVTATDVQPLRTAFISDSSHDEFEVVMEDAFTIEMVSLDTDAAPEQSTQFYAMAFGPEMPSSWAMAASPSLAKNDQTSLRIAAMRYDEAFGPALPAKTTAEAPPEILITEPTLYEVAFGPVMEWTLTEAPATITPETATAAQAFQVTVTGNSQKASTPSPQEAPMPRIANREVVADRPSILPSSGNAEQQEAVFAGSVSDGELSTYRGAFAQETTFSADNADQINANVLTGTSAHNSATNVITGNNSITPGAINFNGVGSFILNSGNNAVVQNSTIINLNMVTSGQE